MLAGASLFVLAACAGAADGPREDVAPAAVTFAPTEGVEINVAVEVADTPAERATGLMYRESLDPYRGMVFVFPSEQVLTFWMKNTYISLDMIFINHAMQVVGVVANAEPLTLDQRSVDAPSIYVVEVNGGFAAQHRIANGTTVRFSGIPTRVPY